VKYIIGFGQFWWDFIVGDSWVMAAGGIGVLVLGYLLSQANGASLAQFLLPLGVFGAVAASLPLRRS
jgi:hypothetical protein